MHPPTRETMEEKDVEDKPQLQQLPQEKCPRCESMNTKFCYYNNYSLAQPRYFCKTCRRYWTKGGALRNVPFGGSCRRGRRLQPPMPPTYERPPMAQPHLAMAGKSTTTGTVMPASNDQSACQFPLAYAGFGTIGRGYYGVPATSHQDPAMVAAAVMAEAYGRGLNVASMATSSSPGLGEDKRLERYPYALPSPYIDKSFYCLKEI